MNKLIALIFIVAATQFTLATEVTTETTFEKTGGPTPAEPEGEITKETDLTAEQTVTGIGFSVQAPANWSFMNIDYSKKPAVTRGEYRAKRTSTGEIILAPVSNVLESDVNISIRNFFPQAHDIVIRRRLYQNNGAKLATKKFQNRNWQIIEYWSEEMAPDKKRKKTFNWYATTKIKDGELAITATTPSPEKRDQYRAPFETIMKSVKVLE